MYTLCILYIREEDALKYEQFFFWSMDILKTQKSSGNLKSNSSVLFPKVKKKGKRKTYRWFMCFIARDKKRTYERIECLRP